MKKLKQENKQIKKALAIVMNRPLLKQLTTAMKRIEKGKYYTEEEFFKYSH